MSSDGLLLKFVAVFGIFTVFLLALSASSGGDIHLVGWSDLQSAFTTGPNLQLNVPPAPAPPNMDWNLFSDVAKATAFVGDVLMWIGSLLAGLLQVIGAFFLWIGGIMYNGLLAVFNIATFNITGIAMPQEVMLGLRIFGFIFVVLIVMTFARLLRGSSP